MIRSLRQPTPLLLFGSSLVAVYAAAAYVVSRLDRIDRADVVALALTLDLTLLVPALYYLLVVRRHGWPAITLLPVFVGSVLVAGWLLPGSRRLVVDLMGQGVIVAECAILALLVHRMVRLRRDFRERVSSGLDVPAALRECAHSLLGPVAGSIVAYEAAVFHYLVFGWRRAGEPRATSFSYHRRTGYPAVIVACMSIALVEVVGVHVLLSLWSPFAAWFLTALGIYAVLWLIGDAHAVRLRPLDITATLLHVRLGLRWTIDIPLASIERVGAPEAGALPRRTPGYLEAVLLGAGDCRIELNAPAEALGPYGITRRVTRLDVQVDEPERFITALCEAVARTGCRVSRCGSDPCEKNERPLPGAGRSHGTASQ